jgi:tripartite-type tricarboxylate transporter receptor subunit TctC
MINRLIHAGMIVIILAISNFFISASAQESYPSKPITLLVGYAPGGTSDTSMRYLANSASKYLGQRVMVVNKEGAGGVVSLSELKSAKPDGYTIAFLATGPIISAHMRKLPFDVTKDFSPIIQTSIAIYGMAVRSDSEFKTMQDWVKFAASNPGKATYSTAGTGSPQHLVMIQLADLLKLDLVHVPTAGGVPAITIMLGGHVTAASQTTDWKPYVNSNQARLLALYTAKRIPEYPNTPTLVELGWNIVAPSVYSIVGPANMPKERVQKLHDAFRAAMSEQGYIDLLKKVDLQYEYSDPAGLEKLIISIDQLSSKALKNIPKE